MFETIKKFGQMEEGPLLDALKKPFQEKIQKKNNGKKRKSVIISIHTSHNYNFMVVTAVATAHSKLHQL